MTSLRRSKMTKEIKNEDIHENFSQQEIRNYLAKELEL